MRIFYKLISIFCLISFVQVTKSQPPSTNTQQDNISYLMIEAFKKQMNDDLTGAIEDCETAETLCPQCLEPHYRKALVYAEMKQLTKADKEIKTAKKLNPNYARYTYYETELNKLKEIDKDPKCSNALEYYKMKSSFNTQFRHYKAAYKYYNKIYEIDPSNLYYLTLLMIHETYNKDFNKLNEHFKQLVIKDTAKNANKLYVNRGFVYFRLQKYSEALADYTKALDLKPNEYNALTGKAISNAYLNNFKEAKEDAQKAINADGSKISVWNCSGRVKLLAKEYNAAISDFEKAISIDKTDPHAYNYLGYVYYNLGGKENFQKAITHYNKSKQLGGDEFEPEWQYKEDAEKALNK